MIVDEKKKRGGSMTEENNNIPDAPVREKKIKGGETDEVLVSLLDVSRIKDREGKLRIYLSFRVEIGNDMYLVSLEGVPVIENRKGKHVVQKAVKQGDLTVYVDVEDETERKRVMAEVKFFAEIMKALIFSFKKVEDR
jgi:hypothetical protein